MTGALIRPAVPDDAAAIIGVRVASWRGAYGAHLPESYWTEYDSATATTRLAASIERAATRVLVAIVDETVVGYTFHGPTRDEDLPPGTGEVYAIYVRPDSWSAGVGHALMTAALADLGAGPVVLWVLAVNDRARRFYELAGFVPDGAEKLAEMPGGQIPEMRYRRG